jgi:hypothetical protein
MLPDSSPQEQEMRDRSLPPFWQTYGPDGDCRRSSVEAFVETVEDANWYRKKNLLALRKCEGVEDFVDDISRCSAARPCRRILCPLCARLYRIWFAQQTLRWFRHTKQRPLSSLTLVVRLKQASNRDLPKMSIFLSLQKSNVGADQLQLDRIVRLLPLWQVWTSLALSIDHGLSLRRVRGVTIVVEPKPTTQGNGQDDYSYCSCNNRITHGHCLIVASEKISAHHDAAEHLPTLAVERGERLLSDRTTALFAAETAPIATL